MNKARMGLTAIALAALAAPAAMAANDRFDSPQGDRAPFHAARYSQRHVEPGPRIPRLPKDPNTAPAHAAAGAQIDTGATVVGFGGGRPGTRTAREVERDSIRKTMRRLG